MEASALQLLNPVEAIRDQTQNPSPQRLFMDGQPRTLPSQDDCWSLQVCSDVKGGASTTVSLERYRAVCTGRWRQLLDELEHEVDANLARYRGPPDEPCHFSFAVPALHLTASMRQILAKRYEDAGWSRAWFEEISDDELLFVLEPSARQSHLRLDGSWFGRLGPPPPPSPRWHNWIHRSALLLLWAAVLCLWFVARSFSAQVTG